MQLAEMILPSQLATVMHYSRSDISKQLLTLHPAEGRTLSELD